jgi:hypothetical protein
MPVNQVPDPHETGFLRIVGPASELYAKKSRFLALI